MWKIDSDGTAHNERGERIFFSVSVLKQERGCGGHRKHLGDFISAVDAKDFIRQTVTKLNAEETNHDRRPMAQTPA